MQPILPFYLLTVPLVLAIIDLARTRKATTSTGYGAGHDTGEASDRTVTGWRESDAGQFATSPALR